ncbi:hypothetical protein QUF80_13160 [Desulfococcaceae bacterium HSG8]|nr:hypothetical protein [Desulfococcaceae bacterium HSG8]
MKADLISTVESSARRLFPAINPEKAFAELLLERAQKNLIKYQVTARRFETKYQQDFSNFRNDILESDPNFEPEQDYFDWEMAITGIADMTSEIDNLRKLC